MDAIKDIVWVVVTGVGLLISGLLAFFKVQSGVEQNRREITEIKTRLREHDTMIESKLDAIKASINELAVEVGKLGVGKADRQ